MVFDIAHIPKLTSFDIAAIRNLSYYGVSWDESQATGGYARTGNLAGFAVGATLNDNLLPVQALMRRCVINDAGVVQYYLDPTDSTKKVDGSASNLDGTDGQVMVEIPKFYHRYSYSGTTHTHDISLYHLPGFTVHDMFVKNGVEVKYRYIGAYEAALYDTSESKFVNSLYLPSSASYKMSFTNADDKIASDTATHPFTNVEVGVDKIVVSGTTHNNGTYDIVTKGDDYITIGAGGTLTNEANATCIIQVQRDWTASTGDVLSSVSGKAPMIKGTRAEFRAVAKNRGTGWRLQDFDLVSAIQLLYLVEYADWNSQSMIGNGLTDWASGTWAAWNNYTPIETTGHSNNDGNATANASNGNGITGSYMSYRGIENFFGNVWSFVDGININNGAPYVSNTDTDFADGTATNYTSLGVTLAASDNYVITLEQIARGFLAASVGGSSSTYLTDYYWRNSSWRTAWVGGAASPALESGVVCWRFSELSSSSSRNVGGRIAF